MVLSFVNRQADLVHRALAAIQQQYVAGSLDLDLRDPGACLTSFEYITRHRPPPVSSAERLADSYLSSAFPHDVWGDVCPYHCPGIAVVPRPPCDVLPLHGSRLHPLSAGSLLHLVVDENGLHRSVQDVLRRHSCVIRDPRTEIHIHNAPPNSHLHLGE